MKKLLWIGIYAEQIFHAEIVETKLIDVLSLPSILEEMKGNALIPNKWIREGNELILSFDNLDWLDKGLPPNEEGRETAHEDDGAINCRVSNRTSNATQERDIDFHRKGKAPRTISSSSSSDDGDNGGSRRGGGTSGSSRGVGGTGEGTGGDGSTGGGYVS
ncbi:hypothetical protein CK203_079466 [Vitis vinifera]|uniref:Uncharacterized protein n=1 Tax=Vitis vinifera TaxID=29760 RepID=A0A438CNY1_VITVI|nr:hypothetical protein CK203_079466 [Vitis vinifera]